MTALLAVLGMVFGVLAFAAPASAGDVFEGNITECPSGFTEVTPTNVDTDDMEHWLWTTDVDVTRVYVKAGPYYTFDDIAAAQSGVASSDAIDEVKEGETADISHILLCTTGTEPVPDDGLFCVFEEIWSMKQFFGYEDTDVLTWTTSRDGGRTLGSYADADGYSPDGSSCRQEPIFYGQTHDYCAVTEGATLKLTTATVLTEFKTQYEADQAMVDTLEAITEGIIPPFDGTDDADFAGLGWTTEGQALFDNDCLPLPPPPPPPPTPRCPSDAAVHAGEVIPADQTEASYCTLPPPPPAEPEPVTVVAPATVEEPETVAVPAPATVPVPTAPVLPATIPAGSGPTIPVYALALLALGATALAATTVHLVRTTR